jgi:GNAT superfamily N-acetyltransferase
LLASEDHFLAVAPGQGGPLLGWVAAELRVLLESGFKAEISGLVVTAQARRSGVGGKLVLAAEHWAAKRGLPAIVVRSNIARMESHAFYQAMSYVRRKTQHSYEKQLSPN